jgi:hypothetical protein
MGYIYIAKDVTKLDKCKIGLTSGTGRKRVSQTENPDYVLHYEFRVPNDQLSKMEKIIHQHFEDRFKRLNHRSSGRKSEWFNCTPDKAYEIITSGKIKGMSALNSSTGKVLNPASSNNNSKITKGGRTITSDLDRVRNDPAAYKKYKKARARRHGGREEPPIWLQLFITLVLLLIAVNILSP